MLTYAIRFGKLPPAICAGLAFVRPALKWRFMQMCRAQVSSKKDTMQRATDAYIEACA